MIPLQGVLIAPSGEYTCFIPLLLLISLFFSGINSFFSALASSLTLIQRNKFVFLERCFYLQASLLIRKQKKTTSLLIASRLFTFYYSLFFKEAPTKSRNSGCGRVGLEVNSGWNCDATNQG